MPDSPTGWSCIGAQEVLKVGVLENVGHLGQLEEVLVERLAAIAQEFWIGVVGQQLGQTRGKIGQIAVQHVARKRSANLQSEKMKRKMT